MGHAASATAALAAGDLSAARDAGELAWQHLSAAQPQMAAVQRAFNTVEVALAEGDLLLARRFADEAVSLGTGIPSCGSAVGPGSGRDCGRQPRSIGL